MMYEEIKKRILYTTNELNSVVSVKDYDHTHQPDKNVIVRHIQDCVEELNELIVDIRDNKL